MHTRCPEWVKTRRLLGYRNVRFRQLQTYRGARVGRQWAKARNRCAIARCAGPRRRPHQLNQSARTLARCIETVINLD